MTGLPGLDKLFALLAGALCFAPSFGRLGEATPASAGSDQGLRLFLQAGQGST